MFNPLYCQSFTYPQWRHKKASALDGFPDFKHLARVCYWVEPHTLSCQGTD
ncbi:MAG: hypothetical protein ACYTXA_32045 [Nostoc sp.]